MLFFGFRSIVYGFRKCNIATQLNGSNTLKQEISHSTALFLLKTQLQALNWKRYHVHVASQFAFLVKPFYILTCSKNVNVTSRDASHCKFGRMWHHVHVRAPLPIENTGNSDTPFPIENTGNATENTCFAKFLRQHI